MKTDLEIQNDIRAELEWDSRLNDSPINAIVLNGHVILSGSVNSYPKKINAEKVARKVVGVKSVDNELEINIPENFQRTDDEIAKSVKNMIKWNTSTDENRINVKVKSGWVILEGEVNWEYQRSKARILAEDISGVKGVTNLITIVSHSTNSLDAAENIKAALRRNRYLNTNKIKVEVEDGVAILTGEVRTLAEKGAVETTAWSSSGITNVINKLTVNHSEVFV
jgi:osmotically-inducible protein OsmY